MAKLSSDEWVERVTRAKGDPAGTQLRGRMDTDFRLFRMEPRLNWTDRDKALLANFSLYTSNKARTFTEKVVSILSQARVLMRVPNTTEFRPERDANNEKERFVIGAFRAADERLVNQLSQPVQTQFGWYGSVRGYIGGRAALVKRDDAAQSTYVDISPWDPRHMYWAVGAEGLLWAVYELRRSKTHVRMFYDVDLPEEKDRDWAVLWDCYDGEHHTVMTDGGVVLKKTTPHGSQRVPVFLTAVGSMPPLLGGEGAEDATKDYGESIFQANREYYRVHSLMTTIRLELAMRRAHQALVIRTHGAVDAKETQQSAQTGGVLVLKPGDDFQLVENTELDRTVEVLEGILNSEEQQGALPITTYGSTQFALSGYAMDNLSAAQNTVIGRVARAMEVAYTQACRLICDQYATGAFEAFQVAGYDRGRKYFQVAIGPEVMQQGGDVQIKILPRLPQDDPGRYQTAMLARNFMSTKRVVEDVLQLQDADLIMDEKLQEMADTATPLAAAFTLMNACVERGELEKAKIYLAQILVAVAETSMKMAAMKQQMAAMGLDVVKFSTMFNQLPDLIGPAAGNGQQPGFSPNVAPGAVLGMPPPEPNQQQGALVPPGTPRPGAQGMPDMAEMMGGMPPMMPGM